MITYLRTANLYRRKMLATILYWWLTSHAFVHGWEEVKNDPRGPPTCLTGHMIDAQSWVNGVGQLINVTVPASAIDLSGSRNNENDLMVILRSQILSIDSENGVQSLSLARCGLSRVPAIFDFRDSQRRRLSTTVERMTFYANTFGKQINSPYEEGVTASNGNFTNTDTSGELWASEFQRVNFTKLRELDLRRCSIGKLEDQIFQGMPKLEALYLGENYITHIPGNAFVGLKSLVHLDLSRNYKTYGPALHMYLSAPVFNKTAELVSLDLSFSKLDRASCIPALENLGSKLKRLSLCHTSLSRMPNGIFRNTPLTYLDVSGNIEILEEPHALAGLENSLQVLYADNVDLRSLEMFMNFQNLEILRLRNNELVQIPHTVMDALGNLQILDLAENRLTTWLEPVLNGTRKLKFLSIRDNNLNLISEEIMEDFSNLAYLAISGNSLVCNCYSRELFEISHRNEVKARNKDLVTCFKDKPYASTGFEDYNQLIKSRRKVIKPCEYDDSCNPKYVRTQTTGNYLLVDYADVTTTCLSSSMEYNTFFDFPTCRNAPRFEDYPNLQEGWARLWVVIVLPIVVFPLMIFVFVYRKNLRYFCVMVKNTATLSVINQSGAINDESTFTYDVFVSYCNDDRDWVLDYLLPHLEQECSVSVCLHERDFQVGLSILENIVSCMDRSKSILLVLSKRFLLSHWCQFEMHLAQHRLLETRREDLMLILLEEIPRQIRPTTLHYLMLTKTYAVWPGDPPGQQQFWKRLKKSLLIRRLVQHENVSWA